VYIKKFNVQYRANRQPTLHEYSIYAVKMRLTDDDAIHYPIQLCGPLNALTTWESRRYKTSL